MRPIDPSEPPAIPAAPVYSGQELYDMPLPPAVVDPRHARPSRGRVAAVLLAFVIGLWLPALGASQATSPRVVGPFLERTISTLADIPALLELHEKRVREAAGKPGSAETLAVPGFPVPGITLSRSLARDGSVEEWGAELLRQSAAAAYERGPAVFIPPGAEAPIVTFPSSQWVRIVMNLVSRDTHRQAATVANALGVVSIALAVIVLLIADGTRRFVAIGLALVGGAAIAATLGLLVVLVVYLLSIGNDSVFISEIGELLRVISWTPIELAKRLAVAGLAIAIPSAVVAAWLGRGKPDNRRPIRHGSRV